VIAVAFTEHPVVAGINHASTYSDMMGSKLSSLGSFEDDEDDLDEEDPYRRFRHE